MKTGLAIFLSGLLAIGSTAVAGDRDRHSGYRDRGTSWGISVGSSSGYRSESVRITAGVRSDNFVGHLSYRTGDRYGRSHSHGHYGPTYTYGGPTYTYGPVYRPPVVYGPRYHPAPYYGHRYSHRSHGHYGSHGYYGHRFDAPRPRVIVEQPRVIVRERPIIIHNHREPARDDGHRRRIW